MSRQRYQLSENQLKELQASYRNSRKTDEQTRYQAVRLYGQGRPVEDVMDITGCSQTSLYEWWSKYRTKGISGLKDHRLGGNHRKLSPEQVAELKEQLAMYTPQQLFGPESIGGEYWSVPDLQRAVERWYGVRYKSKTSYRELFNRCGFSYQRPAKVYRSRSETKVAEFEAALEKN